MFVLDLLQMLARALPQRVAYALMARAAVTMALRTDPSTTRAGRCYHPEEDRVMEMASDWFSAWRDAPNDPAVGFVNRRRARKLMPGETPKALPEQNGP